MGDSEWLFVVAPWDDSQHRREAPLREPIKATPTAAAQIEAQVKAYMAMGMTEACARYAAGDETAIREAEEDRRKHIGPTGIDRLLETTRSGK